ncbi:hypothetical protein [Thiomicrospira sp. XS5]|uniref:hypothetical protein n=1 Tax=Thiomicrospira sp. XS5 TaxID=1775636 RepID=UPI00128E99FB|nr:hypothetical protein [Thiomicrospira sp. XS5]
MAILRNAKGQNGLKQDNVSYYLRGWERAGYLSVEPCAQRGQAKVYTLVKDTGVNPPRVNVKGKPITQGDKRLQMWNTLRITRQLNYRELAAMASTDDQPIAVNDAQDYLFNLYRAGYLIQVSPSCNSGTLAVYRLKPAMNTGPKPPLVQRTQVVIDQNLRQVVWPRGEEVQGDY